MQKAGKGKRGGGFEPRMDTNEGSSGFPARDLSAATGLPGLTLQGEGGRQGGPHAKTRRREGKAHEGEVTGVMSCPALLSTFSSLRSMAWTPWPPHPRPLSPVSRGRGEDCLSSSGFPARDLSAATGLPGLTLQGEGGRPDCSILPGFLWEPVELTEIWK